MTLNLKRKLSSAEPRITIIGVSTNLGVIQELMSSRGLVARTQKFTEPLPCWETDYPSEVVLVEEHLEAGNYLKKWFRKKWGPEITVAVLTPMNNDPEFSWKESIHKPDEFIKWPSPVVEFLNGIKSLLDKHELKQLLKESQNHLQKAQRQARLGSWELDLITGTGVWSSEMFRLFDLDASTGAPSFETFLERVHPEDRALILDAQSKTIASGFPFTLEYRILTGSSVRWVQARAQTVLDKNGRAVQLHGTCLEITDRKRAEEAHLQSEGLLIQTSARLSRVLDSSLDAICTFDKDGRFVQVSAACKQIWGYDAVELIGTLASEMGVPEDKEKTDTARAEIVSGKPTLCFENRYFRKDGTIVHVMWTANWSSENQEITCVARDVTQSRLSEEALRLSEEQFSSAFKFATIGMALVAPEGRWLRINRAVCQMLGYSEAELLAKTFQDITHPEDLEADMSQVGRMLSGEIQTYRMEKRYHHKSGRLVWALLSVSLIRDRQGKPQAFISQIQDITEQKLQERNRTSFYNMGRQLNTAHNARKAGDVIVKVAEELFGWDAATLFHYLPDEELVQVVLTIDTINGTKVECDPAYNKEKPSPLSRRTIEQGALLLLRNESERPTGESVMFGDKTRPSSSLMFVPIRDGTSVIGVLSVQSYKPKAYTEADLETLQSLADYCGGALNRIQAEQKRQTSEQGFKALAESMPQIVWITRADGWNIYFNQRWMDFTGLSLKESMGNGWSRPFHPDERARAESVWRKAISTGGEYSLESRLLGKDGNYRWMLVRGLPLRNAEGEILNWFGTCTDIDDLKKALDAVRESEDRFRLFAKVTSDAIWDWNLETDEMWWNEGFTQLFGYAREEIEKTSASWENRIHLKDHKRVVSSIRKAIEGTGTSWTAEYDFIKKDGTAAFVLDRGHVIRDRAGKPLRMIGGMTDLSARKASEEKLREQAALLDQTSDAVLVRTLRHEILFWNKGAEKIYGWPAAEVIGKSARDLFYRDPADLERAMEKVVSTGEWNGELNHQTKAGLSVSVYCRWSLMRDQEGKPKSILAINTDITERKQLEQQFLRSQRMESIGTLAGGIAHDLNNVLAPILLSIELLKLEEERGDKLETLNTIENSAKRGADMVRQVLSFARGVAGRRVDVPMGDILKQVSKIINETFPKNIEVQITVQQDLLAVSGDPTQLHQVLINLCVNARDAMPAGGVLRLSAENTTFNQAGASKILGAVAGNYVLIRVEDSGTGIAPGVMDQIFDPFFTTKELGKGTGLGLSTSQAIVKSHGGLMQVQSTMGLGAIFSVYLPAHAAAKFETPPPPSLSISRGNGEHILVVDDEPGVRIIVRKTLESFGYQVSEASDGEEAMVIYEKHGNQISLVLTDMMMPMMDGPATIQALRKTNPAVKIIAASGLSVTETVASAKELGVHHFLPKPFTTQALLELVKKALLEN